MVLRSVENRSSPVLGRGEVLDYPMESHISNGTWIIADGNVSLHAEGHRAVRPGLRYCQYNAWCLGRGRTNIASDVYWRQVSPKKAKGARRSPPAYLYLR